MAVFAMTDCYIGFGTSTATDRSTLVKSVTLTVDAATLDTTDFGDAGWTTNISGLKSGSLAMTFNQDVVEIQIDASSQIGSEDKAGVKDIVMEGSPCWSSSYPSTI